MDETQERRDGHLPRVSLEALVDVCAGDQAAEAFQGQSVDVSQRGMQLKSPFVPQVGVPLVLRFHDERGEVLAEGQVVWRTPGQRGGEFGVRFTAVDSQSAGTLQNLCRKTAPRAQPSASCRAGWSEPEPCLAGQLDTEEPMSLSEADEEQDTEPTPPVEECPEPEPSAPELSGAVRLHIDGLGRPLSGRGQPEGSSGLCVASSLDFLKLGKPLWVESDSGRERRQATIRGVDVRVAEPSDVPELVVRLGYDASASAERPRALVAREQPVDARSAPQPSPSKRSPPSPSLSPLQAVSQAFDEEDSVEPPTPYSDSQRSSQVQRNSEVQRSAPPTETKGACDEPQEYAPHADDRHAHDATSDQDASGFASHEEDFDEQDAGAGDEPEDIEQESEYEREAGPSLVDRLALGATVAGRVAGHGCRHAARSAAAGMGWLVARTRQRAHVPGRGHSRPLRRTTAPPRSIPRNTVPGYVSNSQAPARREQPPAPRMRLRVPLAAAALVGTAVLSSWLTRSGADADAPSAPALSKPGEAEPASQSVPQASPVPGDQPVVPLFGPAQLEASQPEPAEEKKAKGDDSASDEDLRFGQQKKQPKPREGSKVFARGRLHLPMVHKLKLNQPGQLLHGESTPTGFEVLIFDRKMMESGAAIARRDDRIAKVVTRNTPEGARVEFRFHDEIPAYKVRLKNGYVEFFINS